ERGPAHAPGVHRARHHRTADRRTDGEPGRRRDRRGNAGRKGLTMLPTLFISHGAPTLAITETPAHRFLQELGAKLPRPKAILVASAHWETTEPRVSAQMRNT